MFLFEVECKSRYHVVFKVCVVRFSVANPGLRFSSAQWVPFLRRWLPPLLLMVAIGSQCIREYNAPGFNPDKADQIAAAESFLQGRGLTVNYADPADLSRDNPVPLIGWPPGYSIALAPLLTYWGDIWWSDLVLQWLFTALFFLAWYRIMELLGDRLGGKARILVWFCWALAYSPLVNLPSGDLLALSCFSMGLAKSIYVVRRQDRTVVLSSTGALFFGASAAMRFAYWPLLVVAPLAFGYLAFRFDRRFIRATVASTLICAACLAGLVLLQTNWTGSSTYLDTYYGTLVPRLYWENLAKTDLYFPASPLGFNLFWGAVYNALYNAWRVRWAVFFVVQMTAVGIVLIALLNRSMYYLVRVRTAIQGIMEESSLVGVFFYAAGTLTFTLTAGMLLYLSVRYPPSNWQGWVYAQEDRYYAPIFGFLVIAVAEVAFGHSEGWLPWTGRLLQFAAAGLLLSCILFVPFVQAGPWLARPDEWGSPALRYGRNGIAVLKAIQDSSSADIPLVFANDSSDITLAPVAMMWGAKRLVLESAPVFRTSKSVIMLVSVDRIPDSNASTLRHPLSDFAKARGEQVGQTERIELYKVRLGPGEIVTGGQSE